MSSVGAGGAGGGEAQAAGLARPRRGRRPSGAPARSTTRAVAAGAPQTSRTARDTASGRSSGSTAAIERAKRIAVPAAGHLLASGRPSRARPSVIRSGVRVSETRVATRWPTDEPERRLRADGVDDADEHAAGAGDRVLHLAAGARRSPGRRPGRRRRRRRRPRRAGGRRRRRGSAAGRRCAPRRARSPGRRPAGGPPGAARRAGSSTRCTPRARSADRAHASLPSHPFVAEEPIASSAV